MPRTDAPGAGARFEIGSISKGFVGLLVAEMAARGELKLDDTLFALLAAGPVEPKTELGQITLAHLVTHTSGLPPLPPLLGSKIDPSNPYATLRANTVYQGLAGLNVSTPPGSRYAYSNWAFLMLSDLLARRTGQSYAELLSERVLKPLRLRDTLVALNDGLVSGRMANGVPTANWDVPVEFAGAGGIRSTLDDMTKLAIALLGDVPEGIPESLRRALVDSMQSQRRVTEDVDIGLAWHLRKRAAGAPLMFQSGMTGGFSSTLLVDRANRRAAVVLADAAGGFDDLALRLIDSGARLQEPRRKVPLDTSTARLAAGRYELQPGFLLTLRVEDSKLFAQATGQGSFELLQDSLGDYYALAADILVRVHRDESGQGSALTLFQGGGAVRGKRLP